MGHFVDEAFLMSADFLKKCSITFLYHSNI
jgi:hypothetical protein